MAPAPLRRSRDHLGLIAWPEEHEAGCRWLLGTVRSVDAEGYAEGFGDGSRHAGDHTRLASSEVAPGRAAVQHNAAPGAVAGDERGTELVRGPAWA
jgi:hypothetical protein